MPSQVHARIVSPRLVKACVALVAANAALAVAMFHAGFWLTDAQGRIVPTDFLNVWAAGLLAAAGQPAQVWDWTLHRAMQVQALGFDFAGNFFWHYPPPFLFVARLLANLPHNAALLTWALASLVPYVLVIRALVGRPIGFALALAFPVVVANFTVGQNGFLTAALIGATLWLLPARPVLAGLCLGLLSYKPQYGLLFPLALIAGGYWRAFAAAAVTTLVLAAASWLAFGTESWIAFFHWMPMASQAFLSEGRATFYKLQSLFGLVRWLGGGETLAWTLHFALGAAVVAGTALRWRSRAAYALKAAMLACGTLLLTPHLFLYDVMVLAIPCALLIREGLDRGFLPGEEAGLLGVAILLWAFTIFDAPTGLFATLLTTTLVLRRIARDHSAASTSNGLVLVSS